MKDRELAACVKRTLFGYAFFLGLCVAFVLYLAVSYAALVHVQQEYRQAQLQEAVHAAEKR